MRESSYPFLAVIVLKRTKMTVVARIEGPVGKFCCRLISSRLPSQNRRNCQSYLNLLALSRVSSDRNCKIIYNHHQTQNTVCTNLDLNTCKLLNLQFFGQ